MFSCLFWMVLPHFSPAALALELWDAQPFTVVQCQQKASANSTLCPSAQALPLWSLTSCLWESVPPVLFLFYLWTILYLHGDTIMWIIKWNAGSAFSAEVSEAESICSSWETAQMYLFSFFAWENWTLHFLLHEEAPHNDYFDGSFPIHSGLSFFSEFILKSGQNLFKMLYLSVNCILTKRRERTTTFYFTKNFSGMSWKGTGNGFQDYQSGVSVQTYTGHFIRVW